MCYSGGGKEGQGVLPPDDNFLLLPNGWLVCVLVILGR